MRDYTRDLQRWRRAARGLVVRPLVAGPPHVRSKMTIYAALIGLTIVIVIILAWIILKEVRILQNKIKLSLERQNQTNLALALQNEIIQEVK